MWIVLAGSIPLLVENALEKASVYYFLQYETVEVHLQLYLYPAAPIFSLRHFTGLH
jgi:hypothetical protein